MLHFLYNYYDRSKLKSDRGLWGIVTTSSERKDFVVALWQFLRSLVSVFRESAVLYFFQVTAMHIHILLSDTVIHLQFVKQSPIFSFASNTLT